MFRTAENPMSIDLRNAAWNCVLLLGGGLAFALVAYTSIELTRGDGRIAMIWVPNAIAVALLLHLRLQREIPVLATLFIGNISANLAAGDIPSTAAILSASNTLEITLAVMLSRRFIAPLPDMRRINHLAKFVLLAGVAAPCVAATASMATLGKYGLLGWVKWAGTDGLSMIIIAPVFLIFLQAMRDPRLPTRREAYEWIFLTIAGTTLTTAVFFQTDFPLLFLVPMVVIAHAFRLGSLGTAFSTFKVGVVATLCTYSGTGPIHLIDHSLETQLVVLQVFLASAFVSGLPVAAALQRQKNILADLKRSEAQISLLTNSMSDAVMQFDMSGICIFASASVKEVLGQPAEAFIGKPANDGVHPDEEERITELQHSLMKGETDRERLTYRRVLDDNQGKPVYIEANCTLVRDAETAQADSIIVSYRDVTERVLLERKLIRARRHAENAALAKSQFLANMSHEIRTPMNGVLGFVDLLLESDLTGGQRQHAELVRDSGKNMMLLLNDILDISKIEAGEIAIRPEALSLRHLVEGCVRLHSPTAQQKGVAMLHSVADNVPDAIMSDSLRLRQILLNLLGNAVKFTTQGAVELSVARHGPALIIKVADSGIGIPPDRLEDIFNPFEQAENSTARKYGGTGLGLSISRRLTELLGGVLTVESVSGTGSCFTLRLPLVEASDLEARSDVAAMESVQACVIPGSRVLLAEDHDINRILVAAMLERFQLEIDIAENGQEAVTRVMAAQSRGRPYQLVLMDVQMPECDGYTATQTIRSLGIDADMRPIVALTANAFEDDIRAAFDSGMQGHLAKPLALADLEAALVKWLPVVAGSEVAPQPTNDFVHPEKSASLEERWRERRKEALDAVAATLRQGFDDAQTIEELARTVHKLAGTAGMFGEEGLGDRAKAFEKALREDGVSSGRRADLAERLLAAA